MTVKCSNTAICSHFHCPHNGEHKQGIDCAEVKGQGCEFNETICEACGKPESACTCEMDKLKANGIYLVADFSMADVFKVVEANVKAKAKAEGKEIPSGEIVSLVLTKVNNEIHVTLYDGKDKTVSTFLK